MSLPVDSPQPEIVICVPGCWTDRRDLVQSVAGKSGGYVLARGLLMHLETEATFEVMIEGPDTRMSEAFLAAGRHWMADADIERIDAHTLVLYLIAPGGTLALAKAAMAAADGLLGAGGLAVKVESTGLAHSAAQWGDLVRNGDKLSVFRAFVLTAEGDPSYSCGMHNIGLRDVIISEPDVENVSALLGHFCLYHFTESPVLRSGETFALGPDEPQYFLQKESCETYEDGSSFANPFGMWRLVRARPRGFRSILARLTGA